jgi:hypothetical protein
MALSHLKLLDLTSNLSGNRPAIPPYCVTKAAVTLRPQRNARA